MNQKEYEFNGFESVIVQHEMDHLDGILFIDRVISPGQLFRRKGIRA
jgi:peptide deformylase